MEEKRIRRLFVANRGEIAVRILRACRALGIETVIGVSDADRTTLGAKLADRTVCIGPAAARDSYLNIPVVITAAKGTGCDAIHPGYGFLSERAEFADAVVQNGLTFVGPRAEAMRAAGDKIAARKIAERIGVPLAKGSPEIDSPREAARIAAEVGYPVLLKASAGGGGRGMRVVREEREIASQFEQASAEAREAFGDGRLFLERFVERARHVEVQVLGDRHGNVVHLGERDCSVQRRHQKLVEEAPAPDLSAAVRARILDAAVAFAGEIAYDSAGTVEFLFEPETGRFHFLEMNTRIQVEHPVTEQVTGIDLVQEQIRIAAGAPLSFVQSAVRATGHAVECRLNAEDPARGFLPSPGRIEHWKLDPGPRVRIDTHCYSGYVVPPFYDSLLAKVIGFGATRDEAIASTADALARSEVRGVRTNAAFQRHVLAHPDFRDARVSTRWVDQAGLQAFRG